MKILIDLQSAQSSSRFRGIGKYSMSLVKHMLKAGSQHQFSILLTSYEQESIDQIKLELADYITEDSIFVTFVGGPFKRADYTLRDQYAAAALSRAAHIRMINPDVVFVTSHFEGFIDNVVTDSLTLTEQYPHVGILYDLIPAMNPEMYLEPNKAYADFYVKKFGEFKKFKMLLAISESAKSEGVDFAGIPDRDIVNIGAAVDSVFSPLTIDSAVKNKFLSFFGISKPFVMIAGATDPRKNHAKLFSAFALLPRKVRDNYQLVVVGKMQQGDIQNFLKLALAAGMKQTEIVFTNSVSDAEMVMFCNLAEVSVSPSLHEGFGLPVLEAMSCGNVVIGSNTSSIPEVIADESALFDPLSAESMSAVLLRSLTDEKFRKKRREHGLVQAKNFSWDKVATKALKAIEQIVPQKDAFYLLAERFNKGERVENALNGLVAELTQLKLTDDKILQDISQYFAINSIDDNEPKRLFVDVSELAHRDQKTGIQRVVRSILLELFKESPSGFEVVPVYGVAEGGYYAANQFKNAMLGLASTTQEDELIDFGKGDIFVGLDLQHHVVLCNKGFYEKLRSVGCKVYFVIYDLLPVQLPQFFPDGIPAIHHQWLYYLATMDGALCISKAVADDYLAWLHVNGPKRVLPYNIGYFHLGADLSRSAPSKGLPDQVDYLIAEIKKYPSFLMVGTVEPRKGHTQTLDAFELLWAAGVKVNLVIIGKEGWKVESLAERLRNHRLAGVHLFWFSSASDEFLELVYQSSDCLICASEGEGFGLPLIEAAQHHIPVLTRDLPVFKEVAGPGAHYFSGLAPENLELAVREWLARKKPVLRDSNQPVRWLNWQESKDQLLANVLEQKWYQTWLSDGVTRYPAGAMSMYTQCGERFADTMKTAGVEGFLIYGPYQPLSKGSYKICITIQSRTITGKEWVDVASDSGTCKLHYSLLQAAGEKEFIEEFYINLDHDVTDLEIRMYVKAKSDMTVKLIEIYEVSKKLNLKELLSSASGMADVSLVNG